MKAEQKNLSFSEDKRSDMKKIRAMSLFNKTTKKLEVKKMEQTFSSFQSTHSSNLIP
jgi:hypothetical protein